MRARSSIEMLSRFIALIVASAIGIGAALWPAPAYAQASCGVVPQILSPLPDGKSYALVLGSVDQQTAQLSVSLYSASKEYRIDLRDVRFDTPADRGFAAPSRRPFQAAPRFIALPNSDELNLVIVNPIATASPSPEGRCDTFLYTERALARQRPGYVTPGSVIMEATRLNELSRSSSATPALVIGPTPFACAVPFTEVLASKKGEPEYPQSAIRERAMGMVQIKVTVAASGSILAATIYKTSGNAALDLAALVAARASTYIPARARCERVDGAYLFRVDFTYQ